MTEVEQVWENNSPDKYSDEETDTTQCEEVTVVSTEEADNCETCEDTPHQYISSESRSNSNVELYTNGVTPLCHVVIQTAESVDETVQAVESISHDDNIDNTQHLVHDGDGTVTYTHYNLQPPGTLTQLTPVPTFETATGHLLPKEDVEAFFSNMDRPTATSVTLTTPSYAATGNGEFTTLSNANSLYQNLLSGQQHHITDSHSPYNMTSLYPNPRALQMQYGANPQATTGWNLSASGDALYSSPSSSPSAAKYQNFSNDPGSPSSGRSDNSVDISYNRPAMPYTNFISQDGQGGYNYAIPNYGNQGKTIFYLILIY